MYSVLAYIFESVLFFIKKEEKAEHGLINKPEKGVGFTRALLIMAKSINWGLMLKI